jgi:hypothetical protein
MKAQFKVLDGQEVIQAYEIEFNQAEELQELFQEARKVWAEYTVEVDTEFMTMSSSHTYAEEVNLTVAS